MTMEIIYFVFLIFNGGTLDQAHIEAWHNYSQGPKFLINRPCEEVIKDPAFQKHLQAKLQKEQKGRLMCKTASEMESFRQLVSDDGVEIAATGKPAKESANKEVQLQGKLLHEPYEKGRRSVQAYMGQEFFLLQSNGEKVALYPTEEVDYDTLLAKKNQTIRIVGRFVDRTPGQDVDTPMQYPMGPDGGPMKRQGYEVMKLKP